MEDIFNAVLSLVMFGLLLAFYLQQRRDRREARRRGPLRGRVVAVDREEHRTRSTRWRVVTVYEVAGQGDMMHTRFFGDEGPALLWARLHRMGSEHDVYPNLRVPGEAFVSEDLRSLDPLLGVTLVVGGGLLAVGLWQMAAWFLDE
jgi:hypothetical protein